MAEYVSRIADRLLADRLQGLGAVVIEGPKACGKTATARRLAGSEVLLDVDQDAARAAAVDPRLVLGGPVPRLLDEWQRAPGVWDAVRRAVDDRSTPGQFILTGSATPNDDVRRHSGAGRISVMRMRPMTLFEQGFSTGEISLAALMRGESPASVRSEIALPAYADRVVTGGWPQLLGVNITTARKFIRDYLETIVEYDVGEISEGRRDPQLVRRFLQAYAQLTAHPARMSTIIDRARGDSGEVEGEPGPTRWSAEPYLRALRRLMVVDEIEPWSPSLRSRSRLISVPKRHLVDPSLAAGLLGCSPDRLLADLNTYGYLFESLAARDVRIYAEANDASVFHYRERSGDLETDLVVEQADGRWAGFEVKLGGDLVDQAAADLMRLAGTRTTTEPAVLAVITGTEYGYRRPDGVWVLPLGCLGP
jgi:uncharacterized protein